MTTEEVASRWRMRSASLIVQRARKKGPPYVRLQGRVLYRYDDIIQYEELRREGLSLDDVASVIRAMPGLVPKTKEKIIQELETAFSKGESAKKCCQLVTSGKRDIG